MPARATADGRVRGHFELEHHCCLSLLYAAPREMRLEDSGLSCMAVAASFLAAGCTVSVSFALCFCKGLSRTFFRLCFFSISDIGVNTFTSLWFPRSSQGSCQFATCVPLWRTLLFFFFSVFRFPYPVVFVACVCVFSFLIALFLAYVLSVCVFVWEARCGTVCQVYTAKDLIRRHVDASGQRVLGILHSEMSATWLLPCAHRGSRS